MPTRIGSLALVWCFLTSLAFAEKLSPARPGGEHSKWYLVKAEEEGSRPSHRGQYEFWIENGVLNGVMLLHSAGTRPIFDLEFDGETLSFRQMPLGPRLVLRGNDDKFEGTWDSGPPVPVRLVLVRAWD